ncbi:hypothetical protein ACU686_03315 [Yinghuangia aomiensis]
MTSNHVTSPPLKVVLADINGDVVEAWRAAFADEPGIEIRKGSILDQHVDAWVSPTNSRGRMDGGSTRSSSATSAPASSSASSARYATASRARCRSAARCACRPARSTPST